LLPFLLGSIVALGADIYQPQSHYARYQACEITHTPSFDLSIRSQVAKRLGGVVL